MSTDLNEIPQTEFDTDYDLILEKVQHINPFPYVKTRNFINGTVTYLSPYISKGVISIKQVLQALLNKGYKPYQIGKCLQELAWRKYYQRIWQEKNILIWQDLKQPQPDTLHYQMINAIGNAARGIITIDQQIENLYATG